jgi:hypothetical protein
MSKSLTGATGVTLNVDTLSFVEVTTTNLTATGTVTTASAEITGNLELGTIADVEAEITGKQDELTASNRLNPNFIDAEDDGDSVIISTTEFGSLTGFDNTSGTIQDQIDSKAQLYDVEAPLVKTTRTLPVFPQNPILLSVNHTDAVTSGSTDLVESGAVFTELSGKQDTLTANEGIDITNNVISFDGTLTQDVTTAGAITGATMNYIDGGVVTNIQTEINSKQDNLTAGTNIIISGNVISATDTNTTYTGGDGISISGTTISVAQVIPNDTRINGGLLVDANSGSTSIIGIEDGFKVRSAGNLVDFSVLGGNTDVNGALTTSGDITTNGALTFDRNAVVGNEINRIVLYDGTTYDYGFGLDHNTLSYNTHQYHSFRYNSTIAGGGTVGMELNETDLTVVGDVDVGGNLVMAQYGNFKPCDFYITTRENIDSTQNRNWLVMSPTINPSGSNEEGRLYLGGYQDETNYNNQTEKNLYHSAEHTFYIDWEQRMSLLPSTLRITNTLNDPTIQNNIDELSADYTALEKQITFSHKGEGTPEYVIGLLNKPTGGTGGGLFCFAKSNSSGAEPDTGIAIDAEDGIIYTAGDIYVEGEIRGQGRRGNGLRATLISFINGSSNGNWGNNSYFDSISTADSGRIGNSLGSYSNGVFTLSVGGTFRITVYVNGENTGVNDRVVAGTYLSINGATSGIFRAAAAGKWGLMYLRDDNYGFGGNMSYGCVVELSSGDNIRIRTKLGVGGDNRQYNDQKTVGQVAMWCQLSIEHISPENLINSL